MKKCWDCKTEKPLEEFYASRVSRDGKQGHCKFCSSSRTKARNALLHPKRIIEAGMKWCNICKSEKPFDQFSNNKTKKQGKSSDCRACARENNHKYAKANHTKILLDSRKRYIDNPRLRLFYNAKNRAKRDGLSFTITLDDIVIPTYCPILGIELKAGTKKIVASSPSLDRIIPELGYIPGNVQVICNKANIMKSNATMQEIVLLGEWAKRQLDKTLELWYPKNSVKIEVQRGKC